MKRFGGVIICFILFFLAYSNASAQEVRILNYNVNRENIGSDDAFAAKKMDDLAAYIVANKIDIVGLQEMDSWKSFPNPSGKAITEDDEVRLKNALQKRNYPMQMYFHPQQFHNVIFSRFPIVPGSYSEILIPDTERWIISAAFTTPVGKMRIVNVHLQHKIELCPQLDFVEQQINTTFKADKPVVVALGDWNLGLRHPEVCSNMPTRWKFGCEKGCAGVDHIIIPNESTLNIITGWGDVNVLNSDHMPQIMAFGNAPTPTPKVVITSGQATPLPTTRPTVTIPTIQPRPTFSVPQGTPSFGTTPALPTKEPISISIDGEKITHNLATTATSALSVPYTAFITVQRFDQSLEQFIRQLLARYLQ